MDSKTCRFLHFLKTFTKLFKFWYQKIFHKNCLLLVSNVQITFRYPKTWITGISMVFLWLHLQLSCLLHEEKSRACLNTKKTHQYTSQGQLPHYIIINNVKYGSLALWRKGTILMWSLFVHNRYWVIMVTSGTPLAKQKVKMDEMVVLIWLQSWTRGKNPLFSQ
jgi:hypothetical protein